MLMEKNSSLPSFNPANRETPTGIISEVLAEFARNFECCLPAIVVSYDRATHTAIVQPAVNIVMASGQQVERAQVSASVWRFMCGGYLIDLPIVAGDTGWLVASDRETESVKTFKTASPPQTYETHKYENGFFIPDRFGALTVPLSGEDAGNMVFQNAEGTEKISIGATSSKITSAALTIVCPVTTFTGSITATGTITGTTDVIATTKSLKAHTHGTGSPTNATTAVNN